MKAKLLSIGICLALVGGCAEGYESEEGDGEAVTTTSTSGAGEPEPEGDVDKIKLEAVAGDPDSGEVAGEAGYAEKIEGGALVKEFEVEVLNAEPGKSLVVTIDGVEVGTMVTDLEGEGDLELIETDDVFFPEGFPEVKNGSVVAVGDIIEFTLAGVVRELSLRATIDSDGMTGSVKFQIERIGDKVIKEFKCELMGAEAGAIYPITLDGQALGDLDMNVEGQGKMKLGYGEDPFPEGFTDPKAGAELAIGDVVSVKLQ